MMKVKKTHRIPVGGSLNSPDQTCYDSPHKAWIPRKWVIKTSVFAVFFMMLSVKSFSALFGFNGENPCNGETGKMSLITEEMLLDAETWEINYFCFLRNTSGKLGVSHRVHSGLAEKIEQATLTEGMNEDPDDIREELILEYSEVLDHVRSRAELFLSNLEILDLSQSNLDTEEIKDLAEALKVNKSLKILILSNNNIKTEGVKHLAEALKVNTSLQSLSLRNCSLNQVAAKYIGELLKFNRSLKILDLSRNETKVKGAKKIAEGLKGNRVLRNLNLQHNSLGTRGIKVIAEALKLNKGLRIINLRFNTDAAEKSKNSASKETGEALMVNKGIRILI